VKKVRDYMETKVQPIINLLVGKTTHAAWRSKR
jgi:hypothetical protein